MSAQRFSLHCLIPPYITVRTKDPAVNEAYDHSGATYDFYKDVFNRNSLDDKGMSLISSVHLLRKLPRAGGWGNLAIMAR